MNIPSELGVPGEITLEPGMEWRPSVEVRFSKRGSVEWRGGYCEGVVYDVLAYYKPYTNNTKGWGIYYVTPNIRRDLGELMMELRMQDINGKTTMTALLAYPSLITIHEFCHHTLENVRRKLGIGKIYERDDEGLCEYTAFKLIEESGIAYPAPIFMPFHEALEVHYHGNHIHVITEFGEYIIPLPYLPWPYIHPFAYSQWRITMNDVKNHIKEALAILYKWWGRDQDPLYRPRVSHNYGTDFLRHYWLQLRGDLVPFMDHALTNKPVRDSLWTRLNIDNGGRIGIITKCGDNA